MLERAALWGVFKPSARAHFDEKACAYLQTAVSTFSSCQYLAKRTGGHGKSVSVASLGGGPGYELAAFTQVILRAMLRRKLYW